MLNKNIKYSCLAFLVFGVNGLLLSCKDEGKEIFENNNDKEINFTAAVINPQSVETRVPSEDSTTYVALDKYDTDFYIRLLTTVDENQVEDYGTYTVASTYEGRLNPKESSEPLQWKSLRGKHAFYGWTFPSGGFLDYGENVFKNIDVWTSSTNVPSPKIIFKDSKPGNPTGYDEYKNNDIYETFIGVKKADVSYIPDGTYVPLIFRHLVSKIFVQELILNQFGSIQEHLKATLTLYNIPNEATFYPLGTDNIDEPVVVAEKETNVYDELSFYIDNNENHEDYLYIPPEIDFSKVSFSVSLTSTEEQYNEMRDYSGSFSNVVFERSSTGNNWDNPTGGDDTILHAGEMMIIRIILYPGGGGGLFVRIVPWSTHEPETSSHHAKPGIYNDTTLGDVFGATTDNIEDIFTLYGSDENVFNLYGNSKYTGKNLTVPDGYKLQGNGHLITCSQNPVTVQNVYDVYLTDGKGNYVYIAGDGSVYIVDPETFTFDESEPIAQLETDTPLQIDITNGKTT